MMDHQKAADAALAVRQKQMDDTDAARRRMESAARSASESADVADQLTRGIVGLGVGGIDSRETSVNRRTENAAKIQNVQEQEKNRAAAERPIEGQAKQKSGNA